jgi:hypothetical protein
MSYRLPINALLHGGNMYRSNSQNFLRVMYVSTFVALFAFSGIVSCNEGSHTRDIKISITKAEQDFVVTIENISDHDVKISKLLSTDPIIGSIHFIVKEDGLRLPLMAQINSPMPSASSYLELYPGTFYGGTFDISHVKRMYGVKNQCYSIQVMYADKFAARLGAFDESAFSSEIKICDNLKQDKK